MVKSNIQLTSASDKDTDTKIKSKSKKSKVKDEPLESKVETLEHKDETLDNVKVDVEIDCRSCSNSSNQCVYIRRKRSI